jgi:hypothetical protein
LAVAVAGVAAAAVTTRLCLLSYIQKLHRAENQSLRFTTIQHLVYFCINKHALVDLDRKKICCLYINIHLVLLFGLNFLFSMPFARIQKLHCSLPARSRLSVRFDERDRTGLVKHIRVQ